MGGLADRRIALAAHAALIAVFLGGDRAAALTREQAAAQCRDKLRPHVQACVKKKVQQEGGPPKRHVDECRSAQGGAFKTCVSETLAASAPSKPAETAQEAPVDLSKVKLTRTQGFVAPPRTIGDITAILEQQQPDPSRMAKLRADADQEPPASAAPADLGRFHYERCVARAELGRSREAIADCEKAVAQGGDFMTAASRYRQFLSGQYRSVGDFNKSIEQERALLRGFEGRPRVGGRLFGLHLRMALAYLAMGNHAEAETYVRKNQALFNQARAWPNVEMYRSGWESNVENGNARLLQARGKFADAEAAYRRAHTLLRDALERSAEWPNKPAPGSMESTLDFLIVAEGQMKARQGRLAEGEADVRRALLSRLKSVGKYHPSTAQTAIALAQMISEQARFAEAEQLARSAVDIYRALGYPDEAPLLASALNRLAIGLYAQRRFDEAEAIYAQLDVATKDWEEGPRARIRLNWARISTNYFTGKVGAGIELARMQVERARKFSGEKHVDYAMAQAILGAGLVYARRYAEAAPAFRTAMPILLATTRDGDYDEAVGAAAADMRMQSVTETYMALLARMPGGREANAAESFQLGELIRGQSVQKALAASSARAVVADPALADMVRLEQDLEKAAAAELGNLNNMLGLPPEERDDKAINALQDEIAKLRRARTAARREIGNKFPKYAELISPRPSSVEDVRDALRSSEALVSVYFGRRWTYVWAVPKQGPVEFAIVEGGAQAFDERIKKLREALDPQAASISDIPPFDLAQAHQLYLDLLKPVDRGWKSAKDIILITNGSLALLPLGLLPTEPATLPADGGLLFEGYRKVAWLARTHAVTVVPSAAALRTLRGLKPSTAKREMMIGFGDPFFSTEQAQRAGEPLASQVAATRGVPLVRRNSPQTMGVDSAELALLPRLPDTSDELKSIALALQADPAKALHLGKEANERNVKSLDLTKYKVVVFATHGLVPGELNGLHQPALAMTAPDVGRHDGDGLLTMEEILALKLDADWVVLSACNTGAGAGAGAEAASGLGRAFFYAGTRAILVTNWSVHSASARELVTDLFRRQAADAKLSRGEALRRAMIELLDKGSFTDEQGKALFAYAHPLFWAPYTIIGDGGAL
jgi:CHAT domain-containing protein